LFGKDNETMINHPHPPVTCQDGLKMSIQASRTHYCEPRIDQARHYSHVEIGFPSRRVEALMPFAENKEDPTGTVYGWVPTSIVASIIKGAGGITSNGSLPPMGYLSSFLSTPE
jgi:hypothetical protein